LVSYAYNPRIFSNSYSKSCSFDLNDSLRKISEIIRVYLDFKKLLNSIFKNKGKYNIRWNDFDYEFCSNSTKISLLLFNLQTGTKQLWEKLYLNIFKSTSLRNVYFIFYFYPYESNQNIENIKQVDTFENEDKLWGYSRFLRDWLKERQIGFITSIYNGNNNTIQCSTIEQHIVNIKYKIENIKIDEISPNKSYSHLIKKVKVSLEKIFGQEFPTFELLPSEKPSIFLPRAYLYNKNLYSDQFKDYQETILNYTLLNESISTHGILRQLDDMYKEYIQRDELKKENDKLEYFSEIGKIQFWYFFRKSISSLLQAFISYKEFNVEPSFLFIDDNPEKLKKDKLDIFKVWFEKSDISIVKTSSLKNIFICDEIILCDLEIEHYNGGQEGKFKSEKTNISELKPDFIMIDLDFGGQLIGLDILRKLRKELKNIIDKDIHMIVLSRYEDPYVIRIAINSGALLYVTKSNFLRLMSKVYQLDLDKINNDKIDLPMTKKQSKQFNNNFIYENWLLLNKLEPVKVNRLKNDIIYGKEYNISKQYDNYKSSEDFLWIKKMPKADLHCHIGSCIRPELLPITAILVLAEKYKKEKEPKEKFYKIINFLLPIILDPFLGEFDNNQDYIYNQDTVTLNYKKTFTKTIGSEYSILEIITCEYDLLKKRIIPEKALFDPTDTTLEMFVSANKMKDSEYFKNKRIIREIGISYDEIMLYLIVLLAFRNKYKDDDDISIYLKKNAINRIEEIKNNFDPLIWIDGEDVCKILKLFNKVLEKHSNCLHSLRQSKNNILINLQSARSEKRCLKDGESSLFNYLRGCEYGGSPHLQTKAGIYTVARDIVTTYAIENNIRYIGLRCAVDSYDKMGMLTKEEALESLLRAFDYYCSKAFQNKNNIHVDIILTAKRHKSLKEFEDTVQLALKYGGGLKSLFDKKDSKNKIKTYFSSPTKVVSFDLAGLEMGNRPSKFYQQFLPLLKECFPITIHAGEEDDYESIWEAIYLVQSQRIGHGLTLKNNENLLKIVKERHIAIELCPISNRLTQGDKDEYPLKHYLNKNIDVTINTDNPYVNDATLVEEYLFGAKIVGGLTKWEILRIIKNGFKAASIPKEEKRLLMDEIDTEIYEKILNEEQNVSNEI
jgi:adenosine deaminase